MRTGVKSTFLRSRRLSLVVALLSGVAAAVVTIIALSAIVLAAQPIGGNPISVQGPTPIPSTSQGVIRAVAAADLDANGHADLAFGQVDQLWIQANVGITAAQWGQTATVGSATYDVRDVHTVDLDRDGAIDLVSASADDIGNSQLRLWQNPGLPFTNPWSISNTLTTSVLSLTSVTSADLDRNGTPDLVSGGLDGVLRLWSNPLTGTQAFVMLWPSPVAISTPGDQIRRVQIADVDRDGWPDIIEAACNGSAGTVRLWRNPGDPFTNVWAVSNTLGTFTATVLSIGVGDLDADGAPDVLAGLASGEVVAWRNPLTGTLSFTTSWGAPATLGNLNLPIVGLAVTDADHNRRLDVIATGAGTSSVMVAWRNAGQPFSGGWPRLNIGNTVDVVFALTIADFDRDGDDDFVTASGNTGTSTGSLQFWTNALIRSSVRFRTPDLSNHTADPLSRANLHAMEVHDMDRDGRSDMVIATLDGSLVLLRNNGSPFVSNWPSVTIGSSSGFFAVAVGDLDGDGWLDIVTSSTLTDTGGLVHVWRNDGSPFTGAWSSQVAGTFPRQVMDLALGDIAREGSLQIVASTGITITFENPAEHDVATSTNNRIWLLRPPAGNIFASSWVSSTVCTTTYSANSIALGDLDNDGWLDVVFGTDHAPLGTTAWPDTSGFYNGSAYQVRACRSLGNPYSMAGWQVYDVGRDDATASMRMGHRYWGAHVWSVAVGDLDRDGYLDVVSGGGIEGDYQILVYKNSGVPFDGSIWEPTAVGYGSRTDGGPPSCPGAYPEDCPWLEYNILAVNVEDLNGDGWLDLVSSFDSPLVLPMWLNTGIPFGDTVADTHWIRYNLDISVMCRVHSIEAVDLDGDGRSDVAAADSCTSGIGRSRVWRNLGGIVRHDFQTDYTLSTIQNGATESRFSFAITHNGRSYDHNLELESLKIRLVNQDSQPLNNTTASVLFQSLQICRDVNGDSIWQPSDSPVVTVTTSSFSLDNGWQTFAFSAGDELATILPGQTVTYFVVLKMQSAASQNSPGRFRLYYIPHEALLVRDGVTQASVSIEEGPIASTRWAGITAVPAPVGSVAMTAYPHTIVADGTSPSTITATVMTVYNYPVLNGTVVAFTTSAGSFPSSPYSRTTTNGVATAMLTSSTELTTAMVTGTATVTATVAGTVTVEFGVGPRASLRINNAPGPGGSEVTTHMMTADETFTVYVAAYDALGRFIDNPTDVTWGGTGVVSGNLNPTTGASSTMFAPVLAGTGTITVADGSSYTDATGTITVTPGVFRRVVIRDAAGGGGSEVGTHVMTADEVFTVYAAGCDADGNYVNDVSVAWTGSGVVAGRLAPTSGISTTLTAGPAGTGTIQANAGGGIIDTTGTITVNAGALHHIVIRDAAGGGGSAVGTHAMTTDEVFTVYAAGYDIDGNYIADRSVAWATTGTLDYQTGTGSSFTFAPTTANTNGTITADAGGGITDTTGTITVNPGVLHHIVIRNAAGGGGNEVGAHTMTADEAFTVWAAGYDVDGNYISDVAVAWTGSGMVAGRLVPPSGISTTFTAGPAGTGTIQASSGGSITDTTGTITVTPGTLHHIMIRDAAGGGGSEVDTHVMTADEVFTVYAAGCDADGNFVSDVSVTWTGSGVVAGRLAPTSGISTTLTAGPAGTGTIQANAGGGITDTTGTITVNAGALHHIVIRDAAGGGGSAVDTHAMTTDEVFTAYAAGYDVDANYIADRSVAWATTGTLDYQTGTGSSFAFAPTTANTNGTITADAGGGITDTTGMIIVNLGTLRRVVIRDAAGGSGNEVGAHTLTIHETLSVWAAGYDLDGNYISDVAVVWTGSGVVTGRLAPTSGISTTFTAGPAGTGTIQASAGGGITDTTGTITVNPGPLDHIAIRDAAGGKGNEVITQTVGLGAVFSFWAAGYDVENNYISDVSVTWTGSGVVVGRLAPTIGISTTYTAEELGVGTIEADDGDSHTDTAGVIVVLHKIYLPLVCRLL